MSLTGKLSITTLHYLVQGLVIDRIIRFGLRFSRNRHFGKYSASAEVAASVHRNKTEVNSNKTAKKGTNLGKNLLVFSAQLKKKDSEAVNFFYGKASIKLFNDYTFVKLEVKVPSFQKYTF